jgi:hypothetical protein
MLYPIIEVLIVDALIFLFVVCNPWEYLRDDDNRWEKIEGDDLLSNDRAPASADTALARAGSFAVLFG